MISLSRPLHKNLAVVFTIPLVGLMFLALGILPKKAMAFSTIAPAISNQFPSTVSANITGSGTNIQPWAAVGVGEFYSRDNWMKVYVPTGQSATVTVRRGGGYCTALGTDIGTPNVNYFVDKLNSSEALPTQIQAVNSLSQGTGCNSNIKLNLSGGVAATGVTGHGNFDTYWIKADLTDFPGCTTDPSCDTEKSFQFSTSNGFIGASTPVGATQNAEFGIYMRDAPNRGGDNWDYALQFAPSCSEAPVLVPNKQIGIFDFDWTVYSSPNLEASVLKDDRASDTFNWITAGQGNAPRPYVAGQADTYGSRRFGPTGNLHAGTGFRDNLQFGASSSYRYLMVFKDVNWHNTIQVSLPYDQFDSQASVGQQCNQPITPTAACIITSSTLNPAVGQSPTITVRVHNTTPSGGITFPTTYQVRQTSPGGAAVNLSNAIAPGATQDGTASQRERFIPNPRGSPTVVTFVYRLFDGPAYDANEIPMTRQSAPVGPVCNITITWGPIAAAPFMQVQCGQTTISNIHTLDYWHPPANPTIPHPIPPAQLNGTLVNNVPAQITITELATGAKSTYTLPGGIPNDKSARSWSTFGMWAAMWPHRAYHFELRIQGSASASSENWDYNDDDLPAFNSGTEWIDPGTGNPFFPLSGVIASGDVYGDCLQADCSSTTSYDVEPGQTRELRAGIHFDNKTLQPYHTYAPGDKSGYWMHVDIDGGITTTDPLDPAHTKNVTDGSDNIILGSGGDNVVNAYFNGKISYRGGFRVTLMFQNGGPLAIGETIPCPRQQITPSTRPFFQVWGGDINTGGAFRNASAVCPSAYPDYVSPPTRSNNQQYGGIKAYSASNNGSLSDFAALSLGQIASNSSKLIDFSAQPIFANSPGGTRGQLNSNSDAYCVPDFYDTTQRTNPAPIQEPVYLSSFDDLAADLAANGGKAQFIVPDDITTLTGGFKGGAIHAGQQITIYVNGSITIMGDITYDDWDRANLGSAPSFVLIARGNINVNKTVKRLDGMYIAQPDTTSSATIQNTGRFNTCAANDSNQICTNQLVINGAVIAQQILPLRSQGTVSLDANPNFSPQPGHNPAEIFNFAPSIMISAPNFNPGYQNIENYFSLPPVF